MEINISEEEYIKLSKSFSVVPVCAQMIADMDTPISVFKKLEQFREVSFLLESVEGGEHLARFSFVGFDPLAVIEGKNGLIEITENGKKKEVSFDDPLDVLRNLLSDYRSPQLQNLPIFTGGAVGYMSYDCIKYFEPLKITGRDDLDLPELFFFLSGKIIAFDHLRNTLQIIVNVISNGNGSDNYRAAVEEIGDIKKIIRSTRVSGESGGNGHVSEINSNTSKKEFEDMVLKAKEYILDGDIFQVVLSQRFETKVTAKPLDIYRALRRVNPSPYMYFLRYKDFSIVGSSPEPLIKVAGKKVLTRPIAGTRRRGVNEQEDVELEKDLLSDKKELAEHIMLVDLGRNDLGRVCKPGTVYPDKEMFIERFSHVMHIVTNLVGELEDDKDTFDALRSAFPAGTVSGAPKIRAMEIIDELEKVKRGPYAGIVGYFSFTGNLDSCITIRTIIVKDNKAYVQAGAGIVADSIPEREYKETENKARALVRAIEESAGSR